MKLRQETSEEWFRKRYPSAEARRKADEAVDQLDVSEPMTKYIDTWITAYKQSAEPGGRR